VRFLNRLLARCCAYWCGQSADEPTGAVNLGFQSACASAGETEWLLEVVGAPILDDHAWQFRSHRRPATLPASYWTVSRDRICSHKLAAALRSGPPLGEGRCSPAIIPQKMEIASNSPLTIRCLLLIDRMRREDQPSATKRMNVFIPHSRTSRIQRAPRASRESIGPKKESRREPTPPHPCVQKSCMPRKSRMPRRGVPIHKATI
jgi:hypothetical protein